MTIDIKNSSVATTISRRGFVAGTAGLTFAFTLGGLGRSGAAINPSTPAANLDDVLEVCDLALVMTINPGFGGQKLIPRTLRKVERVRAEIDRQGLDTEVEVDGGVDASNARACVEAGANVLVAGTAVFGHADGPAAGGQAVLAAATGAKDATGRRAAR